MSFKDMWQTRFHGAVMAKVEGFIAEQDILNPNPRKGYLIALDENGDIAHACVTSEKMSVSSAEFIEARKAREAKHAFFEDNSCT